MITEQNLPDDLMRHLAGESKDFIVKSRYRYPRGSYSRLIFMLVWLTFPAVFIIGLYAPLFINGETHFTSGGEKVVATWDNLSPLLPPTLHVSLFFIAGGAFLGRDLYRFFKKGGYFIGTAERLIDYHNGNLRSIDWEQFSGQMKLVKNNLTLTLRSGKMVSRKNDSDVFVPDTIYMAKIANANQVAAICQKRIKENTATL